MATAHELFSKVLDCIDCNESPLLRIQRMQEFELHKIECTSCKKTNANKNFTDLELSVLDWNTLNLKDENS